MDTFGTFRSIVDADLGGVLKNNRYEGTGVNRKLLTGWGYNDLPFAHNLLPLLRGKVFAFTFGVVKLLCFPFFGIYPRPNRNHGITGQTILHSST